MQRRELLASTAAMAAAPALRAAPGKTLRVAMNIDPAGFDPPQVSDWTSVTVCAHIFESPLTYDYLARPVQVRPQTAVALPEVSTDFRRFVFTLRPGILFGDDPVFKGRPRELVAADYTYSIKRYYDPALKSEHLYQFENAKILGLSALRRRAVAERTAFPYDAPVDGLRVLERYRFEVRLSEPAPRFIHVFASPALAGAVAREVVEAYADDVMAHPVGTGAFALESWRRGSRVVLARNPRFRPKVFDSIAATGDEQSRSVAEYLAGKRLPRLDRVEIDIVEEAQPRWLAFVNGEHDVLELPAEFAPLAVPRDKLAPYLERRGIMAQRAVDAGVTHTYFNCTNDVVGGVSPPRVALRRAAALAYDNEAEIRLVRNGQAVPAQSMISPHVYGFDPTLRSETGVAHAARANALLDLYGYVDRNGDGWRERPDGSALVLRLASTPTLADRRVNELWRRRMNAVGLRIEFEVGTFGQLIKRSLAGDLMMWGFSWSAGAPDCDFFLGLAYGPNSDQSNDSRFSLPAFDRLYERQRVLPDGPERLALVREATRLMLAYMPYLPRHHRVNTDLLHPNVRGHLRHPFRRDVWCCVDLEPAP